MTRWLARWSSLLLLTAWSPIPPIHAQEPVDAGYRRWFEAAVDLDRLWQPMAPGEQVQCWSEVEPTPLAGSERVLVRAAGAGVLARIWLAEARGVLRFYLGAERQLVWEVPAFDLGLRGPGLPGAPWIAATGGGGVACRVPVPFTDGLLVTTDASGDVDYQAQVLVPGDDEITRLRDFDLADLAQCAEQSGDVLGRWLARTGTACTVRVPLRELPSDRTGVLAGAWQGPGVLRAIRIRLDGDPREVDLARQHVSLGLVVDGEDRGALPIDALRLGAGTEGLVFASTPDGAVVLRLPVPCVRTLRLELSGDGDRGLAQLGVRAEIVTDFEARPVPEGALRFGVHEARTAALAQGSKHVAFEAVGGAGRFAGLVLCADNRGTGFWGGGGEEIRVDGERHARWRGTGVDAYVGASLASNRAFVGAFEGQPVVPADGYRGRTQVFRFHALEAVPFGRRIGVGVEARPFGGTPFDLTTYAFAYTEPDVTIVDRGLAPGDSAQQPAVRGQGPLVPGQIEGEDLRVVAVRGGEHQIQRLNEFSGARWSGDAHLWWLDGKPGDRLVVAVPIPAAGRYRLLACWTTARDYGIARVSLGGEPVGAAFDLYTEQVRNTGFVEHGLTPELEEGEALLEIELVGRNEKAIPRHMVGLDALRLVPVSAGQRDR